MPALTSWGGIAGVERVIRAGFAPRTLNDIQISVGPGPNSSTLEVLAEDAAVADVFQALTTAGYPCRVQPIAEARRDRARTETPDSLAAADGILSIVVCAPMTRDDVPAVLDAALSRFEELRTPLFDPSTEFSIDAGPAGTDQPGTLEILFSPKPAHRDELLGRLRKGLAAAGYDAWQQDIPELVGSGTLSILVSRSPNAEQMIASALSETIDRLTCDARLAAHGFLSDQAANLGLCTAAARDELLVRFVVTYLVSTGMVTAAPAEHPGRRALALEEPYLATLARDFRWDAEPRIRPYQEDQTDASAGA